MLKIGFWLDWNGRVDEEFDELSSYLSEVVLRRDTRAVLLDNYGDMRTFDGDVLCFDYGGVRGGYGGSPVVAPIVDSVTRWCDDHPDRIAILWCTFPAHFYLEDFGRVPENLVTWSSKTREHDEAIIVSRLFPSL